MTKQVLDVGQCGADHATLRALIEAAVLSSDEEKSLAAFSQLRGDEEATLRVRHEVGHALE